ncbi:V-type proton ATPase subunit S1-like [Dendronephthya gigantea]|uniref:V-type proton ATPase subunit S1-like n=1 Tax=Dendronephthya gigantea TaxID=151771 RepID=UPI00106A7ADE|nr:V-type proton ATPase subunit S1-like [Dendronephthya gigantea]
MTSHKIDQLIIKMATAWTFLLVLIAISFRYCNANSYPVPLLIWSTKSVDVDDEILEGHTLNYEDVQVKYLDKLKEQSKTICLFVQDKLSIDDFAATPSVDLKHLKDVLHSSPTSIVLPSVSLKQDFSEKGKNKLVEYLKKNSHGAVIPLTAQDITDFPKKIKSLPTDEPTVIIVHLPKAANGENSMRNLQPSDEIIGQVSDILSGHFPDYIALLTADMPRDDIRSGMADARQVSVAHTRERRSSADDSKDDSNMKVPCNYTGVLVNGNGTLLYIKSIFLSWGKNSNDSFENTSSKVISPTISNGQRLSFNLGKDVFKKSDVIMSVNFNKTGVRWWCGSIEINGTADGEAFNASYDCSNIWAPFDRSFACQLWLNYSDGSFENYLNLSAIQLQPSGSKNYTFYNSVDCVGFFTPVIWMGLISVGVLVAILYGGMLALLSIKSMDRFDNPKDPSVVINSE